VTPTAVPVHYSFACIESTVRAPQPHALQVHPAGQRQLLAAQQAWLVTWRISSSRVMAPLLLPPQHEPLPSTSMEALLMFGGKLMPGFIMKKLLGLRQ
jgi:hypothetical protein